MKKEMAVFVINSLQNGGAERVVVNQAQEMSNRGYAVTIILVHDSIYYQIDSNINIIVLGENYRGITKLIYIPIYAKKIDTILEEILKKNHVILLTANLPYVHYICRFSKFRKKFLYVMHNPQFHFAYSKMFLYKKFIKWLLKGVNVVGVSQGVVDELNGDYELPREDLRLIYNPINFKEIDDLLQKKTDNDIPAHKFLLFVGRLTAQKNIFRLLEAYKKSSAFGNLKLIILGIGELSAQLHKYVVDNNIEDEVIFKGWEHNVFPWMAKADGLICSSDYESFGMVIAEALYCDCPVVSTNCKFGPSEILVDEYTKYLSELNSESLSKKIDLLVNDVYPNNKKRLVEKFQVDKIMDEYIRLYKEKVVL